MISVVMATFNRSELLARSLDCYTGQDADFELVIINDGSTDDTADVLNSYKEKLPINIITLPRKEGWRDFSSIINRGIKAAKGDFVLVTHPEVMPGVDSLAAIEEYEPSDFEYVCCKAYYLTERDQTLLLNRHWRESRLGVRNIPGFYDQSSPEFTGNPDYLPRAVEAATKWDSWLFGGLTKATWEAIGGSTEHEQWGSVDIEFLMRRNALSIPNITLMEKDTYCLHQWHESPRDLRKAINAMQRYETREAAMLQA